MRSIAVRCTAVVGAVAVIATAAGCDGSPAPEQHRPRSAAAAPTIEANRGAQDVAFLQKMIKHHEQSLDLAAMVSGRTADEALIALARQIAGQQQTEMDGFRAQLLQWDEPLGAARGTPIAGWVDQATLDELKARHGADFEQRWLASMLEQHRGAVAMARQEVAGGQSPDVISIATSVAASQQQQADQIEQMLEGR